MRNTGKESLWAITCHFNPAGYRSRLENYRLFRQRLAVPLLTVELAYGADFEIQPGEADILIQLRGQDVLWQKERLLNLALRGLPPECDKVAWLDSDIVFARNDWPDSAHVMLDRVPIVQLFDRFYDLRRGRLPEHEADQVAWPAGLSLAFGLAQGLSAAENFQRIGARLAGTRGQSLIGLAWAARREVLQGHGFYDTCILGSGDRAFACAALGCFDDTVSHLHMNPMRGEHYLAWAKTFFQTVRGRVGYVPGNIYHLWHGDLNDRAYGVRHQRLELSDFDPYTDISLDASGCWRWNSAKPDLHRYVRNYFFSRHEDGKELPGHLSVV
jgi:hypothetical protein